MKKPCLGCGGKAQSGTSVKKNVYVHVPGDTTKPAVPKKRTKPLAKRAPTDKATGFYDERTTRGFVPYARKNGGIIRKKKK